MYLEKTIFVVCCYLSFNGFTDAKGFRAKLLVAVNATWDGPNGFVLVKCDIFITEKNECNNSYRAFQLVVFNSGQKMALRAFYFIRTLTKALTYY